MSDSLRVKKARPHYVPLSPWVRVCVCGILEKMYGFHHRPNHNRHQRCTVKIITIQLEICMMRIHEVERRAREREKEGRERKIKLGDGRLDPKSNTFLPSLPLLSSSAGYNVDQD